MVESFLESYLFLFVTLGAAAGIFLFVVFLGCMCSRDFRKAMEADWNRE